MRPLRSLQARLTLLMLLIVPLIWLLASASAAWSVHKQIDELYDTEMAQFARQLLTLELRGDADPHIPPKLKHLLRGGDKGEIDNDEFGLAVWNAQGDLLLSDGRGRRFRFAPDKRGFYDYEGRDDDHHWRLIYLADPESGRHVAVGQRAEMRHEMVLEVILAQLTPWLAGLPLMLLLILWALRRELRPLRRVAAGIAARDPADQTPVRDAVPSEIQPLLDALNTLFERVATMLERERRFTADAAHELRTPLAGLRVQAEVIGLMRDEAKRQHALEQLQLGIVRATRLVEQLLAMSRLDPLQGLSQRSPIRWREAVERVMAELEAEAAGKRIALRGDWRCPDEEVLPLSGDQTLLELLLRNLLENAVRYSPPDSLVAVELSPQVVTVRDQGPGVAPEYLERVRERFFRPPGQDVAGSGLGLSIVERVADLHGLRLRLANREEGGLSAELSRR